MMPEISDRIVEIDRAMRWGYANKLGPFELWDALGFEAVRALERRPRAARQHQDVVRRRRVLRFTSADKDRAAGTEYFDFRSGTISRSRNGRASSCWPI
jgi:3-hydroxyacyl-CoA dehydrogenase